MQLRYSFMPDKLQTFPCGCLVLRAGRHAYIHTTESNASTGMLSQVFFLSKKCKKKVQYYNRMTPNIDDIIPSLYVYS